LICFADVGAGVALMRQLVPVAFGAGGVAVGFESLFGAQAIGCIL
jgi:hypothetical protein